MVSSNFAAVPMVLMGLAAMPPSNACQEGGERSIEVSFRDGWEVIMLMAVLEFCEIPFCRVVSKQIFVRVESADNGFK